MQMRFVCWIAVVLQLAMIPRLFAQNLQPNILVILVDGIRRSELGCYGSTNMSTPNIDGLATHGLRFTDAYSAAPVEFESLAALSSGKHPTRLQRTESPNPSVQNPSHRVLTQVGPSFRLARRSTLTGILSGSGYATADYAGLDLAKRPNPRPNLSVQTSRAIHFIEKNLQGPWFVAVSLETTSTAEMDASVGILRKSLEVTGQSKNTLVILTATHGAPYPPNLLQTASTAYQPLNGQQGYLHEGGIRVPLIISWPQFSQKGSVSHEMVVTMDFFATILAASKGKLIPSQGHDGYNLLPLFQPTEKLPRDFLCWHYPHYASTGSEPASAIRFGRFKLIQFYDSAREELFDLSTDVGERRNLADSNKAEFNRLRTRLELWKQVQPALPPRPNPEFSAISKASANGVLVLPGRLAEPHGKLIRYEPQPHKNTVGYWANGEDWVSWRFDVSKAGLYEVEIQQGCGTGGPGSDMRLNVGDQSLTFVVQQTGHFQNFVTRKIGQIQLEKGGSQSLELRASTKRGGAVVDIRQIRLIPVKGRTTPL